MILSGYDDFAYAQAAIRNKVFDYVLKPVSSRDLAALLAKIKDKLDADRRSREDETALKEKAGLSGDLLRERSLLRIPSRQPARRLGFRGGRSWASIPGRWPARLSSPSATKPRRPRASPGAYANGSRGPSPRRGAPPPSSPPRAAAPPSSSSRASSAAQAAAAAAARPRVEKARSRCGSGLAAPTSAGYDAPRAYAEAVAALAYRLVREPARALRLRPGERGAGRPWTSCSARGAALPGVAHRGDRPRG